MHTPYQNRLIREPDFVVEYEIDLDEEIKSAKPTQGMRVDFLYEGDRPEVEGVHMIWPEILDKDGSVIIDNTPGKIPDSGHANMWVVSEERINYHLSRIHLGTKGFWYRGGKIANVTVVKINGKEN